MTRVKALTHDSHARKPSPHRAVAEIASRQEGTVSYEQLRAVGFGRGAVQHRLSTGWLHRMYPGVYAVGHRAVSRASWLWAALLYCGPDALLSHWTAVEVSGYLHTSRREIHVTVPGRRVRGVPGLRVHQTRRLDAAEATLVDGLAVTSFARTMLDLAAVARLDQVIAALEQSQRMRVFDLRPMEELLDRSRGRKGAKALREALAELADDPPDERSRLERDFRAFCKRRRLPEPGKNIVVEGFTVDAAWPDRKVVVELDTYDYHGGRRAFESDRKRDVKLQLAGHRIVRVTRRRLNGEPDELEHELRILLGC